MSTNDAKEAIKGLTDENVLLLLNACDSRKAIKGPYRIRGNRT